MMTSSLRHFILLAVGAVALFAMADDGPSTTAYNFLNVPVSSHVYGLGGHNLTLIDDDINLVEQNPALLGPEFDHQVGLNYMRYIGEVLLTHYPMRIINLHPALLPSFPGAHGIADAYHHGVRVFGITIHFVDEGVDTGKIIDQFAFHSDGTETLDEIETHIHQLEHQHYPETINMVLQRNQ